MSKIPVAAKAKSTAGPIRYRPILGIESGYAALDIYKPDSFFGRGEYACMVGGCGVGHCRTLVQAKSFLLGAAKRYCQRQIDEAKKIIAHYESALALLEVEGLVPLTNKEKRTNASRR